MQPIPKAFKFKTYHLNPQTKTAVFDYEISFVNRESLTFSEKLLFPKNFSLAKIPTQLLETVLQSVHLMLGISYFKLYCPPKIELATPISKAQAQFFKTVYRKGLGEFFYRNQINPAGLLEFPHCQKANAKSFALKRKQRALVGIGGGKDSIVAGELLKKQGEKITAFLLETQRTSAVSKRVVAQMQVPALKVQRLLDEKIFVEHEGAFNGHIPISAVFAFVGYLTALLYDYANVIVANERSSNFGNVDYLGAEINHQWSKSAEFENLFQQYCREFLSPDITYFSLLRPFYEIRIAEMFAKHKAYFPLFTSCNRSFRVRRQNEENLWCGQCAKCVFVFILLSAFLSKKELLKIFGKNLYAEEKLLPLFAEVLGFGKMKPFDCVGTFDEAQAALWLAREKFATELVMQKLLPKIKKGEKLVEKVRQVAKAQTLPGKFKFLGLKNILILGYGKEGKMTERYLHQQFPDLKVGVADAKTDANYLAKQAQFDFAIKTPGIPKEKMEIPYTTATNLFFAEALANGNQIVGVTGSKGKSTTASLVHAILKEAKMDVSLLGNIGKPMLEVLLRPLRKKELFVLELSSYQLDDLEFSPHLAVVTNLFPEHLDYHGELEKYYSAKKNIVNFQRQTDFFIFPETNKALQKWAAETCAQKIAFAEKAGVKFSTKLLGKHNQANIAAAVAVAKQFEISAEVIARALQKFQPLPHRLEFVGRFRGVDFFDDAISTTPQSTIQALETLPNIGTIFLGGQDRGYDFAQLEKKLHQCKIKNVVLFPDSGQRILKNRQGFNILETSDMAEAVAFAFAHTPQNSICLLSTASPSYSVWKNFEEKGDLFQRFVKEKA